MSSPDSGISYLKIAIPRGRIRHDAVQIALQEPSLSIEDLIQLLHHTRRIIFLPAGKEVEIEGLRLSF